MGLTGKKQEDLYFHQRDVELLNLQKEELRKAQEAHAKQAHRHHCAQCGGETVNHTVKGLHLEECRECGSVLVAKKDLGRVLKLEYSAHFQTSNDDEFRAA